MKYKKTMDIKFACVACGFEPELKEHGQFRYTETKCPKCGGTIKIKFNEGDI